MRVCIPASKAKIETSYTSAMVVHNNELRKFPVSIYSLRVSKSMTRRLPSRDVTKTGHRLQAAENTELSLETPTDCGMLYLYCQYDPGVACMQRSREGYLGSPTMTMRIAYEVIPTDVPWYDENSWTWFVRPYIGVRGGFLRKK